MINSLRKILTLTTIMFLIIVMFTFIGFHMGYDGLLLMGELEIPLHFQIITNTLLFSFEVYMWSSISWGIYGLKSLKISWPLILILSLIQPLHCSILTVFILPSLYILGYSARKNILNESLKRWSIAVGIILLYQIPAMIYKLGYSGFTSFITSLFDLLKGKISTSFYQDIMFSVDLLIYLTILYAIGGVNYYVGLVDKKLRKRFSEYYLIGGEEILDENGQENCELEEWYRSLTGFKQLKAMSILLGGQVLQWILCLFICRLGNVFIEGLIISTSFIVYGFVIKKKWHSNSILICTLVSSVMFYASAKTIPVYGYTQLFPVITGLFLTASLYLIALYVQRTNSLEKYIEKMRNSSDFKLERYCDYDKMKIIAENRGLTLKEIELLKYKYCKAFTQAQLEIKFSPWSLSSIKRAIKIAEQKFYKNP